MTVSGEMSEQAWRRSRRDRVFWLGLAPNATLLLGFVGSSSSS